MVVNTVINNDEMILNPAITDWASIEKKVAYITVANMFDMTDNMQESPITWTAFITKNPLKWFIEGYSNTLNISVNEKQTKNFQLVLTNVSGLPQNYSISLPSWLTAQTKSGTIAPNSQFKISLVVDSTISAGNYFDELKLISSYNYVEKIQTNLRVLRLEPDWNFNPSSFEENMNIIGKIKIDGILSNDIHDKLVAYYMDTVRGIAPIQYDPKLDEYFAMLTIYGSSEDAGLPINFKIWDASAGILKTAAYNNVSTIQFQPNLTSGNYRSPIIFTNSGYESQIVNVKKGWTWLSFNVEDSSFRNLNTFFRTSKLTQGDILKTSSPALFDIYNVSPIAGQSGWFGSISLNGGLNPLKMYKAKIAIPQNLMITGLPLDLGVKSFNLDTNWIGLPYIANRNLSVNEALAYLDVQDGDIIKSQSQFAIYDNVSKKWKGSLTTMTVGEGYMVKIGKAQLFKYPPYANANSQTLAKPELPTFVNGIQTNAITSIQSSITTEPLVKIESSSIKLNEHLSSFAETMNMVAKIPNEFDRVEFYNSQTNELIGQSQTIMDGVNKLVFSTIYGDTSFGIKAKLSNSSETVTASNNIIFTPNNVLGSIKSPYLLDVNKSTSLELNAYPNPFISDVTIEFNADINGEAVFNIYNDQTKLIESKVINVTKGLNKFKYHVSKAAIGNYIVFKVDVGEKHYTKLLIKQ
jgi:hypothetical protein